MASKCDHSAPALATILIRAGLAAIRGHSGPFLPLHVEIASAQPVPSPTRDTERILKMNEPRSTSYKRK